jgi:uncharacterized protein
VTERPIFNVAQLQMDPLGAIRKVEVDADLKDLAPDLVVATGMEDVGGLTIGGPVRLMHTTEGVLAQGELWATVQVPCSRCLEPAQVALEIALEETFVPTLDVLTGQVTKPAEDDEALWIDQHHLLDLSEVLRQDVLLALPMHVLCREDCKGLCPTCGNNLNEGACDCAPDIDPRWAALQDLLDQEKNEPSQKE